MKPVAVLLSGCGVFDGSEIQEAVCTLLELAKHELEYVCVAPNHNQLHVINHATGEVLNEQRNILVESARISRGQILDLAGLTADSISALIIVGGFGAAKNLTTWALAGAAGAILPEVSALINSCFEKPVPIVALCMGPTVVAKALFNSKSSVLLTVGSTKGESEYDIASIQDNMKILGATIQDCTIREISIDHKNRIISAPCYMMKGNITDVHQNVAMAIDALVEMI